MLEQAKGTPVHDDAAVRFDVGKPGWEESIGAFLVFDHEWFWQNRERLLGSDPQEAMLRIDFGVRALTRDEAAALRDENELSAGAGVRWRSEPAAV